MPRFTTLSRANYYWADMHLIDLLLVIAAILIIIWLVGLAYAVSAIIYFLPILALIIILFRLVFGRRA